MITKVRRTDTHTSEIREWPADEKMYNLLSLWFDKIYTAEEIKQKLEAGEKLVSDFGTYEGIP